MWSRRMAGRAEGRGKERGGGGIMHIYKRKKSE